MASNTPGPWLWDKRTDGSLSLVHPRRGYLLVMDFVRLGMQKGTARFAVWKGDERENMGGLMKPAHEIDLEGHPDARLIAAAPELLAACEHARNWLVGTLDDDDQCPAVLDNLMTAIQKATGNHAPGR